MTTPLAFTEMMNFASYDDALPMFGHTPHIVVPTLKCTLEVGTFVMMEKGIVARNKITSCSVSTCSSEEVCNFERVGDRFQIIQESYFNIAQDNSTIFQIYFNNAMIGQRFSIYS
jgi:hypothetical protein